MALPPKEVEAITELCLARGEAWDVINWSKREFGDAAAGEIARTERIVAELESCIEDLDFVAAIKALAVLNRQVFKLRAIEAGPFARTGRKHHADFATGRNAANRERRAEALARWMLWQLEADEYWRRHPGASKHEVALHVQRELDLTETPKAISRRLKKAEQAS